MDTSKRVFGIIDESINGNIQEIVDSLINSKCTQMIYVFSQSNLQLQSVPGVNVEVVRVPEEKDTRPKMKNFAIRHIKNLGKFSHLHLIEDRIQILKDPNKFISDIEHMMRALSINNFFGTVTDGCNYVYSKYNPRLNVVLDNLKYSKLECGNNILFCSHSNVQWIVINLEKADDNELYFDEDFKVDMYWIIEFLARRRNSHQGSLYYMNQYITCSSEYGVYKFKSGVSSKSIDNMEAVMREEDALFKQKCLAYSPDNNIDNVLENLYSKLISSISQV